MASGATDSSLHPARGAGQPAGINDALVIGGGARSEFINVSASGNDRFEGEDDYTILDFKAGAGSDDLIDLSDVAGIDDFGEVLASARNFAGGVVLDFGDDEITLLGVSASQLHADDFVI